VSSHIQKLFDFCQKDKRDTRINEVSHNYGSKYDVGFVFPDHDCGGWFNRLFDQGTIFGC